MAKCASSHARRVNECRRLDDLLIDAESVTADMLEFEVNVIFDLCRYNWEGLVTWCFEDALRRADSFDLRCFGLSLHEWDTFKAITQR